MYHVRLISLRLCFILFVLPLIITTVTLNLVETALTVLSSAIGNALNAVFGARPMLEQDITKLVKED